LLSAIERLDPLDDGEDGDGSEVVAATVAHVPVADASTQDGPSES